MVKRYDFTKLYKYQAIQFPANIIISSFLARQIKCLFNYVRNPPKTIIPVAGIKSMLANLQDSGESALKLKNIFR